MTQVRGQRVAHLERPPSAQPPQRVCEGRSAGELAALRRPVEEREQERSAHREHTAGPGQETDAAITAVDQRVRAPPDEYAVAGALDRREPVAHGLADAAV